MATNDSTPNITDALMAVSTSEKAPDQKRDALFECVVSVFDQAGLNHINAPNAQIVWSKFTQPPDLVDQLGDNLRDCITSKGFPCPGLAGSFEALRDQGMVTSVSALIDSLMRVTV
jgi:hypothetical protein